MTSSKHIPIVVHAIAACDPYGTIGRGNSLPWPPNPADMEQFKETTYGHTVIMGTNTYESLPERFYLTGFPGRRTIVVGDSYLTKFDTDLAHPIHDVDIKGVEFIGGGSRLPNAVSRLSTPAHILGYLNDTPNLARVGKDGKHHVFIIGGKAFFEMFIDGSFEKPDHGASMGQLYLTVMNRPWAGNVKVKGLIEVVNSAFGDTRRVSKDGNIPAWELAGSILRNTSFTNYRIKPIWQQV